MPNWQFMAATAGCNVNLTGVKTVLCAEEQYEFRKKQKIILGSLDANYFLYFWQKHIFTVTCVIVWNIFP